MDNPSLRFGSAMVPNLSSQLQHLVDAGVAPGLTGEFRGGNRRLVGAGSKPPERRLTAKDRFPLGCGMKVLLAVKCLELIEAGNIAFDTPVVELLPEVAGGERGSNITVAHLLTHTSGVKEPSFKKQHADVDWDQLVASYKAARQMFTPGSVWSFSHANATLIARMIMNVTGQTSRELMLERVIEPLRRTRELTADEGFDAIGHQHTGLKGQYAVVRADPDLGVYNNATSLDRLSAGEQLDFARYLFLGDGSIFDTPPSEFVRAHLLKPLVEIPARSGGVFAEMTPTSYGAGVAHFGRHAGWTTMISGTTTAVRMEFSGKTSGAVCMTCAYAGAADRIMSTVGQIVLPKPPESLARLPTGVDPSSLSGDYLSMDSGGFLRIIPDVKNNVFTVNIIAGHNLLSTATLTILDDGIIQLSDAAPGLSLGISKLPDSQGVAFLLCNGAYGKLQ